MKINKAATKMKAMQVASRMGLQISTLQIKVFNKEDVKNESIYILRYARELNKLVEKLQTKEK